MMRRHTGSRPSKSRRIRLRHIFALDYLRQNPGKLVDLSSLLGHATLDLTAFIREPPEKSCKLS